MNKFTQDENNSNIQFLQLYPNVAADALLEIFTALILVFMAR
jgi:hypothetical protein